MFARKMISNHLSLRFLDLGIIATKLFEAEMGEKVENGF